MLNIVTPTLCPSNHGDFFFRMDQLGSYLGAAPRQRVPHSCMSNSVASDVEGIIATVPWVEKCGPFFDFLGSLKSVCKQCRWWFQIFFFSPLVGEDSHFD